MTERMMVRWLLLLGVLAALAVSGRTAHDAYACHPDRLLETRVNLDGDRAKEEVVAAESHDCAHTTFKAYVHVRDRCRGAWRTYDLGSEAHTLQRFRIVNADARTKRPEVFFVTRRLGLVAGASPPPSASTIARQVARVCVRSFAMSRWILRCGASTWN